MQLPSALLALLLLHAPPAARCSVYTYKDSIVLPDLIQYRRVGMWAPLEAPASHKRDESASTVSIELKFQRSDARLPGLVQLVVFHSEHLARVGAQIAGKATKTYCCSAALAASGSVPACSAKYAGHLIIAPDDPLESEAAAMTVASGDPDHRHRQAHHHFSVHNVAFAANQTSARLAQRVLVRQSGVHYLVISSCEARTGAVRYSGQTQWRNPYGFLPAELYPFLPFFGGLSLGYLLLGLAWGALCCRHYSQLLPLQVGISWVVGLAALESLTWFASYRAFNDGGARGLGPTVLGVLISTTRKTVSRLLVLTVCLGYGVVRPTLGEVRQRIALIGAVYFVASAALDVASNVSRLEELPVRARRRRARSAGHHSRAPRSSSCRVCSSQRGCSLCCLRASSMRSSSGGASPPSRARSPSSPIGARARSCSSTGASRTCSSRCCSSPPSGSPGRSAPAFPLRHTGPLVPLDASRMAPLHSLCAALLLRSRSSSPMPWTRAGASCGRSMHSGTCYTPRSSSRFAASGHPPRAICSTRTWTSSQPRWRRRRWARRRTRDPLLLPRVRFTRRPRGCTTRSGMSNDKRIT